MRRINYVLALLALGVGGACQDSETPNQAPIANAGPDQQKQEVGGDGCEGLPLPDGQDTLEVTLDGSASSDEDGKVVEYFWLNAKLDFDRMDADGGPVCPTRRDPLGANVCLEVAEVDVGDAGADAQAAAESEAFEDALDRVVGDTERVNRVITPTRVAQPTLALPEGRHKFALWVVDDDGARSTFTSSIATTDAGVVPAQDDSLVEIIIGCPDKEADRICLGDVFEGLDDSCKSCVCAECPALAPTCNETCWGLINCVATECGGDGSNLDCIIPACSAFLAAANEAIAMTDCAVACTDACSGSATGPIGDGGGAPTVDAGATPTGDAGGTSDATAP